MTDLWDLAPDYAHHAATVRTLATHLLARARFRATGRFGLRPTPGGLGTGRFGDDHRQVRLSGAVLVDETGGAAPTTRLLPLAGRTLGEAAEFLSLDLDPDFSVGADTAALPGAGWVVDLDDGAARQVGDWYRFCDQVLLQLIVGMDRPAPSGLQVWPEHFDLGTDLDCAPGGPRANVGGSPGDDYLPEPYLYVGPHGPGRPGDPGYWNAPFGAALSFGELRSSGQPVEAAVAFLRRGTQLLAEG